MYIGQTGSGETVFKKIREYGSGKGRRFAPLEKRGEKNGENVHYVYNLYDVYDFENQTISMARTTGYTCTAVANLVINEQFTQKGICPPEFVGEEEVNFNFILDYLKQRNVNLNLLCNV